DLAPRHFLPAPPRFIESWVQMLLGMVCVGIPVLVYANAVPFAEGDMGAAEWTILATMLAYIVVAYCSSRLEAFPGASLTEQAACVAPIVLACFGTIGIVLLAFRVEYSRVQFFGSGLLVFFWLVGAAYLRSRLLVRYYAVIPDALVAQMPEVGSNCW